MNCGKRSISRTLPALGVDISLLEPLRKQPLSMQFITILAQDRCTPRSRAPPWLAAPAPPGNPQVFPQDFASIARREARAISETSSRPPFPRSIIYVTYYLGAAGFGAAGFGAVVPEG